MTEQTKLLKQHPAKVAARQRKEAQRARDERAGLVRYEARVPANALPKLRAMVEKLKSKTEKKS